MRSNLKHQFLAEYQSYYNAKNRCDNPASPKYKDYGGRGIEFRFRYFSELLADIGPRPTDGHTLDRINVEGHYEQGNVRWATQAEQQRNRRDNVFITVGDETLCVTDWALKLGSTKRQSVADRLKKGWCNTCAVTVPLRGGRCIHRIDKRFRNLHKQCQLVDLRGLFLCFGGRYN